MKRLVILLHGYEQSGDGMAQKLLGSLPPGTVILAPNGPFPLPRRSERDSSGKPSGYRVGYSWYFYNPQTDEYLIDMEISVGFIAGLVRETGYDGVPTTLIGFSQGGYLAPFIAQELKQVDQVIGLSAQYLVEEIELPVRYRADAVHGALDEIVSPQNAKTAHEKLLASGAKGEFRLLASTGHRIDPPMREAVAELLKRR